MRITDPRAKISTKNCNTIFLLLPKSELKREIIKSFLISHKTLKKCSWPGSGSIFSQCGSRIRIRIKIKWILSTGFNSSLFLKERKRVLCPILKVIMKGKLQGILVPKLTLRPFLTLRVRIGPIFIHHFKSKTSRTQLHHIFIKNG